MAGWLIFVDFVRALVFAAAHVCGNSLGGGILAVSLMVRLALLPLTLRAARRTLAHQRQIQALSPQLATLRARYGSDRANLAKATLELYQRNGVQMVPSGTFSAILIQLPIASAIYQALGSGLRARSAFLWIADLTRPDAIVAIGAAVLAGVAGAMSPPAANRMAVAFSTLITLFFAWRLSASVGLYLLAANAVGVVQSKLVRPPGRQRPDPTTSARVFVSDARRSRVTESTSAQEYL